MRERFTDRYHTVSEGCESMHNRAKIRATTSFLYRKEEEILEKIRMQKVQNIPIRTFASSTSPERFLTQNEISTDRP